MKKIVVKVGTSTLTEGKKQLSPKKMKDLARQLAALHHDSQLILVSSGAIAAGRDKLNHPIIERSMPAKQMFAAVGQVQLMKLWTDHFKKHGVSVGQVLLTKEDLSDRNRYLNARDTLECLLHHKVLPIVNENDTVATQEIKVGDNDNLAALVANLIGADLLILLTDQEGLYTADPRINSDAEFIPLVKKIDASIFNLAKGSSTKLGVGGMVTKIEAAQKATQMGASTIICSSNRDDVLIDVVNGKKVGTHFLTSLTPQQSRKRWLLNEKVQGQLIVDEGAALKISKQGASLLPSGIQKVNRSFDRGAIVQILDPHEVPIAVGISNYGHEEIKQIKGKHSNTIEKDLGYSYGAEVIHRSNLCRLQNES